MTRGRSTLRLKRGHDTPRSHPWIFKGDVAEVSDVEPGSDYESRSPIIGPGPTPEA